MAVAMVLALATTAPAAIAKGCIKGAVVGGAVGHYVGRGHGLLGAATGCVVGHHHAAKEAREQQQRKTTYGAGSSDR
jgi:uncharacterized protein YcfJ